MSNDTNAHKLATPDVVDYYSRNWEKIAQCYTIDAEGLPIDPAWYRRRLYQDFLDREKPATILDIGCGGGWTVLDACERGLSPRGVEPVGPLCQHGQDLLAKHGHDSGRIAQGDLSILGTLAPASLDCIALLSVLPHVPRDVWDDVHRNIARALKPGGRLIAAYRNQLFDLFTFNGFTVEFYDQTLWGAPACAPLHTDRTLAGLKGLIANPDVPGPYFTAAQDKSFGKLDRMKSNPMLMPAYLAGHGLAERRTSFYHYHCTPPLLLDQVANARRVNHDMELSLATDWRGHFMAAMFLVEAIKA